MLTIRAEQMGMFSRLRVESFEAWMLVHIRKFFPARSRRAADSELRDLIRPGIERAAANGITNQRDVCKFIDLMLVFGGRFETDMRFPWAREILASQGPSDSRMRSLLSAARKHLRELAGATHR